MIKYKKILKQISYILNNNILKNFSFIIIEKDLKNKLNKNKKKTLLKTSTPIIIEKKKIHFVLSLYTFKNIELLQNYLNTLYSKKNIYNLSCTNNKNVISIIIKPLIFTFISNFRCFLTFNKIYLFLHSLKYRLLGFLLKSVNNALNKLA